LVASTNRVRFADARGESNPPMTTAILDVPRAAPTAAHNGSPKGVQLSRFWVMQLACWSVYAAALMVPWLGRYSVFSMIPNKLVIGGTGLLATAGLRLVYRRALQRTARVEALFALALGASAAVGTLWSAALVWLLGSSVGHQLGRIGSLEAGVPAFAGAPYHALVLLVWSLAYVGFISVREARRGAAAPKRRGAVEPAAVGAAVVADDRAVPRELLARDGRRTVVLAVDDVDWIEADGDYVRVHTRGKSLLLRDTMSRLETTLTTDFQRIHRSAIVNVSRVSEVSGLPNRELAVTLRGGARLRASRTYAERLRAALGMVR
jgi:hypothetical protein